MKTLLHFNSGKIQASHFLQNIGSLFLLAVLIVLSVRYCDLHDYRAYYLTYSTENKMEIEIGYLALGEQFSKWGFPFYVFYGFILSFVLISLRLFFKRYSKKPFLLLFVFFIYPYINELQQIRSAFGAAIIFYGMRHLLDGKENIKKYFLYIALASFFHTTSVLYAIFALAVKLNYKTLCRISWFSFIFGIPIIAFLPTFARFAVSFVPYWAFKYTKWIESSGSIGKAALLDWAIYFLIFVIFYFSVGSDYCRFSYITQKMIKISFTILIMTLLRGVGNSGYRPAMMMLPFFYTTIIRVSLELSNRRKKRILKLLLLTLPVASILIWWGPLFPDMYMRATTEMWRVWDYYY